MAKILGKAPPQKECIFFLRRTSLRVSHNSRCSNSLALFSKNDLNHLWFHWKQVQNGENFAETAWPRFFNPRGILVKLVIWVLPGHPNSKFANSIKLVNLLISAFYGPLAVPCLSFVCLSSRYGDIWPNLHFFNIYWPKEPYNNPIPLNTKQCQVKLTKYQPVLPCTDPVLSNITQYHPILTKNH